MKLWKKITAMALCAILTVLPVAASESEEATSPTLAPYYVGVQQLTELPVSWNPTEFADGNQKAILTLTSQRLYRRTADGSFVEEMAQLPVDVTGEYAGTFGVPANATRGYAFEITIRDGFFWENGKPVTDRDWLYTIETMMELGKFPLELANYGAFLAGLTHPATEIQSLMDAGFSNLEDAKSAGFTEFYIETEYFWGLEPGWYRVDDRTRLFDAAIPSGCEEMYITPAYLYNRYLGENGTLTMFQSESLGIPVTSGAAYTRMDVGLLVKDGTMVLILAEPATAATVTATLAEQYPLPSGTKFEDYGKQDHYLACGPYRIASATAEEITLEPNPYWTAAPCEFELVRCIRAQIGS